MLKINCFLRPLQRQPRSLEQLCPRLAMWQCDAWQRITPRQTTGSMKRHEARLHPVNCAYQTFACWIRTPQSKLTRANSVALVCVLVPSCWFPPLTSGIRNPGSTFRQMSLCAPPRKGTEPGSFVSWALCCDSSHVFKRSPRQRATFWFVGKSLLYTMDPFANVGFPKTSAPASKKCWFLHVSSIWCFRTGRHLGGNLLKAPCNPHSIWLRQSRENKTGSSLLKQPYLRAAPDHARACLG